ncbi:condensation domain-containing protein, partial [Aquimarina sp. M1]
NDSGQESSDAIAIPVVAEADSYELSSSQYRLWVLSQFDQSSSAYHMISCDDLRGDYDISNFKRAIDSVLARHEILRTVFREDSSGTLRQWVLPLCDLGFSISYEDYREFSDADLRVSQYVEEDSYKPFDLSNGPLLRASLLHVSDDHYVFYYNMHHIISDGWSMEILTRDIMHYYESYCSGLPVDLGDLRIQFKDYSGWEQSRLRSGAYDKDKFFWLDKLSGELPLLDLPTQQLRPKVMTSNGEKLQGYLSKDVKDDLVSFCHQQGGSLFMGLLAVWNILFYKYTSQRDIIIGTPVAGRDHSDLSDQIGFYVNTLALRNQVDPSLSFRDFYLELQSSTLLSYQHQMYPFGSLVEDLGLFRDTSRSAVFDVMVTLQNRDKHYDDFVLPDDQVTEIKYLGHTIPKFDLDIDFQEVGDCLFYDVAYNSDVYDRDMIEGMMGHFNLLVSSLLSSPDV